MMVWPISGFDADERHLFRRHHLGHPDLRREAEPQPLERARDEVLHHP